ncbi:MAG TPA: riboflavin synthase [Alphaproteobacteria bacterium]|nr:riboflavin synthase [Alphaproteobacteria bacterium]
MFTGITTDLGTVRAIESRKDSRFVFATGYDAAELMIGNSIACSGVCLTIVDKGPGWFAADVSAETLSRTTLADWRPGTPVNFERPLAVGGELGGHFVAGHIDGIAKVVAVAPEGDSLRFTFEADRALMKFIAPKGSVALDGVALTVNEVEGTRFGVNIIPHTRRSTTFASLETGGSVNLEVDLLARYVERLVQWRAEV